jgi:glycosyltransferase involved in cell wall biosynthesis/GT2 family glycosyltransferase
VTIIICAYTIERWSDLCAAVESARTQTYAPLETIVVIDHNPELFGRAQAHLGRHPGVRVVESTGPKGLSGARNTGLAEAKGEIVAFLDDDAVADRTWLGRLVAPYADDRVVAVGGRIVPSWEEARPRWFPEEFDWVIGCSYRGMPQARSAVRNVIGANMSFRRQALLDAGGFACELGRTADAPLGDEETEACIRVRQMRPSDVVLYEPSAVVAHRVPQSRGTWRYFRSRCYGEGLSKATLASRVGGKDGLSTERRYVLATLPAGVLGALTAGLLGPGPGSAGRAAAIAVGLAATAAGYAAAHGSRLRRALGELLSPAPEDIDEPPVRERPRVLMVTPRFPPLMGGVENHVQQVAGRLHDADVTVLTTDPSGTLPREEVVEGVRVRRVRAWPRNADWYVAPGLWRIITHGAWDIVHVQSYHTAVAPLAMLAALSADIPYVLTFHGGGHSSALRRRLRGIQRRVLRPLLARAERLICVARFEAAFYQRALRLPAERFVVIPNGSDLPVPQPPYPTPPGRPLLVSIGRLEKYKGHHRVVAAMPSVLQAYPDAHLLVLGSGPYQSHIEALAAELGVAERVEVRAIPTSERREMAATLATADLVVLMSDFETHPLAAIEAIALGRPALVADTSGLAELAETGAARAIPVSSSPVTIAAAIVNELHHPRPVPHIDLPTWDQAAQALRWVYRQVLALPAAARATASGAPGLPSRLPVVAALSGCGVLAAALGNDAGWRGLPIAEPLFWLGLVLVFAPAVLAVLRPGVSRREIAGIVAVVGVALYVISILDNPTLFTGFDELLHYRTLDDIARTGRLFNENPLLPISPFFPGLEIVTNALMSVTGMSGFAAGATVIGVARLLAMLGILLLLQRVGLSARTAGLGVLLYATTPSFLFFEAQYAYESLALPLAVITLVVLREAQLRPGALGRRLDVLAAALVFAVTFTHHVTSYILAGALLAWLAVAVIFRRRFPGPLPGRGWVPLLSLASVATWFWVVARKTAAYLLPHLGAAFAEAVRLISGDTAGRKLFQSGGGQTSPALERVLGLLAVAIALGLIVFAISRVRAKARTSALALLLGLSVFAYPISLGLRFTQSGWAVGSRALAFLYVGLAFVLACGMLALQKMRRPRLGPLVLTAVVTLAFVGGVIAGSPSRGRIASPYSPASGRASIEAEGVGAATWARSVLGPGNRIAADSTNSSLMGSYGQQRTLSAADGISVSGLFLVPEFGDYQRRMIEEGDIEYVVVDRRLAGVVPFQGYFFETWEKQVVDYGQMLDEATVGRFDTLPGANRVFDSGNIQVYDVRGLTP